MIDKITKKPKKLVYKESEFETYILWKSLPPLLRGITIELAEKYGFTDPLTIELLSIKNQTQFAKKFGISDLGTLSDWNKKILADKTLLTSTKNWGKCLTSNVIFSLYKRILRTGDAASVKLWMQLVEGWEEKLGDEEIKKMIVLDI